MRETPDTVHISARQFASLVTAGYLSLGLFEFPRPAVAVAGREAIWSLWLAAGAAFLLMHLMFRVNRLFAHQSVLAGVRPLISVPGAALLSFWTIGYHLALAAMATLTCGYVLANVLLPETPVWAIVCALVFTGLYIAWLGTAGLARTLEATYIPVALMTVIALISVGSMIRHPILLLPPPDFHVVAVTRGIWPMMILFIGFQVSINLYPFVRPNDQRAARRNAVIGLGLATLVLTVMYECVLATIGPADVLIRRWPPVSLFRQVSVQSFFINRLGLLVIVLWTVVVVAFLAVRLWCLGRDLEALLGESSGRRYRIGVSGAAAVVAAAGFVTPNGDTVDAFRPLVIGLGIGYLTVVPFIVLTAASLRRRRYRETREAAPPPG